MGRCGSLQISLEWSRIIWSGDLKVVGVCLNFYFQERFNFYRVVQKGKGFLNFCSVKTASRYSIQYPILVLRSAFLALFWGWPTRTRRRLSPSSSSRLQLLAWALSTQDSLPTPRTLPPTLQVHILRWRRVDFNHPINQRHNSRVDQLHWLNTWLCGSSSCKRNCGEQSFLLVFWNRSCVIFPKVGDDTDVTKWRTVWIITIAVLICEVTEFPTIASMLLSFNCFFRSSSSLCLPRANPRAGITKTKLRDRERIGSWSVPYSFYFLPVKTDILHNSHRSSSRWELHWWELSMLASRWASMATKDLPIQLNGNIPSCLFFPP